MSTRIRKPLYTNHICRISGRRDMDSQENGKEDAHSRKKIFHSFLVPSLGPIVVPRRRSCRGALIRRPASFTAGRRRTKIAACAGRPLMRLGLGRRPPSSKMFLGVSMVPRTVFKTVRVPKFYILMCLITLESDIANLSDSNCSVSAFKVPE